MSNQGDLVALFAGIRPQSARNPSNMSVNETNGQSYYSHQQQLPHSPSIATPTNGSQRRYSGSQNIDVGRDDRTQGLLNLLKFSQPQPQQSNTIGPESQQSNPSSVFRQENHGRGISASDLVASFSKPTPGRTIVSSQTNKETESPEDPQQVLLKLLNTRQDTPNVPQEAMIEGNDGRLENTSSSNQPSPSMRVFGNERNVQPSTSTIEQQKPVFTYVNPFDALAASSPRNRTPKPETDHTSPAIEILRSKVEGDGNKRKPEEHSPESNSRRKLTPIGVRNRRSPSPAILPTKIESVSNALDEVAGQVDKQAGKALDDALTQADQVGPIKREARSSDSLDALAERLQQMPVDDSKGLQEVASITKEKLAREENKGALEDIMPSKVAEVVKDLIDDAANGNLLDKDSWESADDEEHDVANDEEYDVKKDEEYDVTNEESNDRVVKVYNFPMRPFISIMILQLQPSEAEFRDDGTEVIARYKKTFDQTDRSLAVATTEYIAYAQVKTPSGVRLIRQEDGVDQQLWKTANDRIFTIALSSTPYKALSTYTQTVLATGVSGTVYWAPIFRSQNNLFGNGSMESESLTFPPYNVGEDPSNTAGGQLKTRARRSCRHPDYFAIGRGKSIYIVFTLPAAGPKYRKAPGIVDTEKFFKDRTLKITTGKAGKDFCFSEDDTSIVSLDKNGKAKFWDIRDLVEGSNPTANKVTAVDIKTPIITFSCAQTTTEKPWPTSVMLLDKYRPYQKGTALRYMIVGLKQNHTLQLWDLLLQKPVQELHFPHSNDADAICSYAYHPSTGILVVGHPSRNSIFFVHLSAPKYILRPMCQADLMQRLVSKDRSLPAPDSTAFMSGIREISFKSKGELRSLDLLSVKSVTGSDGSSGRSSSGESLFELYVVHSKGLACLSIKKEDLGWSKDNKVVYPLDAVKEGIIELSDLAQDDSTISPKDSVPKETEGESPTVTPSKLAPNVNPDATPSSSTEKPEKKKKGRKIDSKAQNSTESFTSSQPPNPETSTIKDPEPELTDMATTQSNADMPTTKSNDLSTTPSRGAGEKISLGVSGDFLDKEVKKIERGVSTEVNKILNHHLNLLYNRMDNEKRVADAASGARTEAILRLVSSTLNENVEKNLSHMVTTTMLQNVLPAIQILTSQTLERTLSQDSSIGRDFSKVHTAAVTHAFQNPEIHRQVAEMVSRKVKDDLAQPIVAQLNRHAKDQKAVIMEQKAVTMEQNKKIVDQDLKLDEQSVKIEQLSGLIRGLTDTIQTMAASQTDFQSEILKLQNQVAGQRTSSLTTESPIPQSPLKTSEEIELAEIAELMRAGQYEQGTLKWLRSIQQIDLFDNYFIQVNPSYLANVSPLVAFSVGVAVSTSFDTNTEARINWLEAIFATVNMHDPEIQEVAPQIMDRLIQRLESLYMAIAEHDPQSLILRKIPSLTRRAREIKTSFQRRVTPYQS